MEENKIQVSIENLKQDTDSVIQIAYGLIESYVKPLDQLVYEFERLLKQSDDLTDDQLSKMSLELASSLYSVAISLEYAGLRDDIARMARKSKYNQELVKVTGKVVDKQSLAELASREEELLSNIATSAYKQIKARVEYGNELLQSIKKVLTIRLSGMSIKE